MNEFFQHAHSREQTPQRIASDLVQQIGAAPEALVLFFASRHEGTEIVREIRKSWPQTKVVGCSAGGEISTGRLESGSVSAAALKQQLVARSAVALAPCSKSPEEGVAAAVKVLEEQLGQKLSSLDPQKYVGLIFIDSTHGTEEAVHVALGNAAPMLSFVGGSASDEGWKFQDTRVLANESMTNFGAALMVLELLRPMEIVKACHFEPTEVSFKATRVEGRLLHEINGRPAAEFYANHLKVPVEGINQQLLGMHPAAVVIDGEPWIRQVSPPFTRNGTILLGCEVAEGSTMHFLRSRGDLVGHFQNQMKGVKDRLGKIQGCLLFDCAFRKIELEVTGRTGAYAEAITFPAAGYSTHGESWLGHMHQTLTAIAFG